jgi:integrase
LCETLKALAGKHPTGPLLRTKNGNAWNAQSVNLAVRKLAKRAGIGSAMPYGYRHGFCTAALSRGIPDAHVAALMGHTSTAMIHRHYSHLGQQAAVLKAALDRVRGAGADPILTARS